MSVTNMDLTKLFGDKLFAVLSEYSFSEISRLEGRDGVAVEYANRDFAVQLVAEVHGTYVHFMPRNDLEHFFPAEVIMKYLSREHSDVQSPSMDAVALFLETRYPDISRIFSLQDGGKELNGISEAVRAENARNLGYDRQWVREEH